MRLLKMKPWILSLLTLLASPSHAEAKEPAGKPLQIGERVLVDGRFERKCSARVTAFPTHGYAKLSLDRAGCADESEPFAIKNLQRITFVKPAKNAPLQIGSVVVLEGLMGGQCSATVKEISRSGYVALDLDAALCADSAGLHKAASLTPVHFVNEASFEDKKFELGQKISTKGIHDQDSCVGQIEKLTDNGLASIRFEGATCAYAGRLYSLSDLQFVRVSKAKPRTSGEAIFNQVMREIASSKKSKKQAHN